jgi:ubiquinone/menaquinone biosynthesis C-methylase UbiE
MSSEGTCPRITPLILHQTKERTIMHKFDPRHLDRLLSSERRQWQNPDVIFGALGLDQGMIVADIGAGPGFFTLPAAMKVGPTGKVYALDIVPEMLERLRERATAEALTNVETLVSRESEFPLPDASVDVALVANVLHETSEPVSFLRESARVLRPGAVLGVVEWRTDSLAKGPPFAERLAPETVEELMRAAGYRAIERFEVGPYHYGIRATGFVIPRRQAITESVPGC